MALFTYSFVSTLYLSIVVKLQIEESILFLEYISWYWPFLLLIKFSDMLFIFLLKLKLIITKKLIKCGEPVLGQVKILKCIN